MARFIFAISLALLFVCNSTIQADDRTCSLDYLSNPDPYYPGLHFPKLITPQWVGEEGVDAVVILAIDDMRDPAKYEAYLRPILQRLKQIDGRAPVSIMTNSIKPDDLLVRSWLDEGLSIECHTIDHPCPLLKDGDFEKAASTYHRCVDLMNEIDGNTPVAFRMPCCDSLNTVSPRFFDAIFNQSSEKGHRLQIDSSVFNFFTSDDPAIPRELIIDDDGRDRFLKYMPEGRGFVNYIENYPYPYVINGSCWEFPCVAPSDWSAQHRHGVNNPVTLADWKSAIDITVIKQGVFCLVFHPHGWIENTQVVDLIDHAVAKHGHKVKFLTFAEAQRRLNDLVGQPGGLMDERGNPAGIHVADVNRDGCVDLLMGTQERRETRVWQPESGAWQSLPLPVAPTPDPFSSARHLRSQFGCCGADGEFTILGSAKLPGDGVSAGHRGFREPVSAFTYRDSGWELNESLQELLAIRTIGQGEDQYQSYPQHIILHDFDHDGIDEILIGRTGDPRRRAIPVTIAVWQLDRQSHDWNVFHLPPRSTERADDPLQQLEALAASGNGWPDHHSQLKDTKFLDVNRDGIDDIVVSDPRGWMIHLFDRNRNSWDPNPVSQGTRSDLEGRQQLPSFSLGGHSNGEFVRGDTIYWQNENTDKLPHLVDSREFTELVGDEASPERSQPKSPGQSLKMIEVREGFRIELVAAEPLVADPVAFDWADDGSLFVAEMGSYPHRIEAAERTPHPGPLPSERERGQDTARSPGKTRASDAATIPVVAECTIPVVAECAIPVDFPSPPTGGEGARRADEGGVRTESPAARNNSPEQLGTGRVRLLKDTDNDGQYDSATVFLDGLGYCNGVMAWRNGVLVSAAPDILYAEDTDGDGVADKREVLFTGFTIGNPQHVVNGFAYGLDNWIYIANGDSGGTVTSTKTGESLNLGRQDLRIKPDSGEMETVTGRTQFGRNRDDAGNWFGNNNSNPMFHYLLEDRYLKRNPAFAPPNLIQSVPEIPGNSPVFPISTTVERFNDFHTANRFTSACSAIVFRDDTFGSRFAGNAFVCEPVHNLVSRMILEPEGTTFRGHRAVDEQNREFLASSDSWFRPVFARTGPDGALWIADMYRLVIEHPEWIPDDWQKRLNLRAGEDKGRIYRVVPVTEQLPGPADALAASHMLPFSPASDEFALTPGSGGEGGRRPDEGADASDASCSPPLPPFGHPLPRDEAAGAVVDRARGRGEARAVPADLVEQLSSANGWLRDNAQRRLVHAGDNAEARPSLLKQLSSESDLGRVHALCTIDGIGWLTVEYVVNALRDQSPVVRRHAVRLSEQFADDPAILEQLLTMVTDDDPHVQLQLACTLGEFDDGRASAALAALLRQNPSSEILTAAIVSSIDVEEPGSTIRMAVLSKEMPLDTLEKFLRAVLRKEFPNGLKEAAEAAIAMANDFKPGSPESLRVCRVFAVVGELTAGKADLGLSPADSKVAQSFFESAIRAIEGTGSEEYGDDFTMEAVRLGAAAARAAEVEFSYVGAAASELFNPTRSPKIQRVAIGEIGRFQSVEAARFLLVHWQAASPDTRSAIAAQMLSRTEWSVQLLDAIAGQLEGITISPREIPAVDRQRLLEHRDAEIRERAKRLFAQAADRNRTAVIERLAGVIEMKGDSTAGLEVFRKRCAACHKIGDVGNSIGADLLSLKDRTTEAMLTAILDPNRAVEAKFLSYTLLTKDGRTVSGMIRDESGNAVTLVGADGKDQPVLRRDIDEMVCSNKSLMPEGLENDLTPEDLAHVIAFVQAGTNAVPKSFDGNQPAEVKPQPDGTVRLTARDCAIYGPTAVYEPHYGNVGFWFSPDDRAAWTMTDVPPGAYEIRITYAIPDSAAGESFVLSFRTSQKTLAEVNGTTESTGSWSRYHQKSLGRIDLSASPATLVVQPQDGVREALMDLREVLLKPVGP